MDQSQSAHAVIDVLNAPSDCHFHTRGYLADPRCRHKEPSLVQIEDGHLVACHHHERVTWPPSL
ncbi:hypothetical protein GC175_28250 [bacterium]|nr:hypothetical protein [bacterium]